MFWAAGSSTWREAHVGGRVWCWSGSLEKPWNCTDLGKQGLRNPSSMGMWVIGIYQYELAKFLGIAYLLDPFWLFVGSCCCFFGGEPFGMHLHMAMFQFHVITLGVRVPVVTSIHVVWISDRIVVTIPSLTHGAQIDQYLFVFSQWKKTTGIPRWSTQHW